MTDKLVALGLAEDPADSSRLDLRADRRRAETTTQPTLDQTNLTGYDFPIPSDTFASQCISSPRRNEIVRGERRRPVDVWVDGYKPSALVLRYIAVGMG
jgi:hypothetical protein